RRGPRVRGRVCGSPPEDTVTGNGQSLLGVGSRGSGAVLSFAQASRASASGTVLTAHPPRALPGGGWGKEKRSGEREAGGREARRRNWGPRWFVSSPPSLTTTAPSA